MKSSLVVLVAVLTVAAAATACGDPAAMFEAACSSQSDCAPGFVCLRIDGAPERDGRCVSRSFVGDVALDTAPDAGDTTAPRPDIPGRPDTTTPPDGGPRDVAPRPDTPSPPDTGSPPPDTTCFGGGEACGTGCLGGLSGEVCACKIGTLQCRDGSARPQCLADDGDEVVFVFAQPEQCNNGIDDDCDGQIDEDCAMPGGCTFDGEPCDASVSSPPEWACVDLQGDGTGRCRPRCTFEGCTDDAMCVSFDGGPSGGYCTPRCEVGTPERSCPPDADGSPRFCQLGALLGAGGSDFCVAGSGATLQPGDDCTAAGLAEFEFCRDNGLCLLFTESYVECLEMCSAAHGPVGSSPHPDCSQPGATCTDAFGIPEEFGLCAL